jgi:hypothetical protein
MRRIAESGLTPLDYWLSIMRGETQTLTARLDAAPFFHARLGRSRTTLPTRPAGEQDT